LKVPTRNVREFRFSPTLNTSRARSLLDRACRVLLELVRSVLTLSPTVFDPACPEVIVVSLTLGPGAALTLGESDVEAEPAVMPTAQQMLTRPMTAVAAATR